GELDPAAGQYGMQAQDVWQQYDIRGDGIVIGAIDTGARYTHDALYRQYRGYEGIGIFDHDYNWYRPTSSGCGDGSTPCDTVGHGTGVVGFIVGENASLTHQIGVAPDGQWIACVGCESSKCSDKALLSCADWMLAPCPIGKDPGESGCDPARRPHIVNNSWGAGKSDMWYLDAVNAWRAAGIFPAFAAGNADNTHRCDYLSSPGDYLESFATAAHNSSGNNLYGAGPSHAAGAGGAVKPNLNSPTDGQTSSYLGDSNYRYLGGTSGASPHTAGAVALCWSVNPTLIGDLETTYTLLEVTARDTLSTGYCGIPSSITPVDGHVNTPNYDFGWGYLDALALVEGCRNGFVKGYVTDRTNGMPIENAAVLVSELGLATETDEDGYYSLTLPWGEYTLSAGAAGYFTSTLVDIPVAAFSSRRQDFSLAIGWTLEPASDFELNRFDGVFVPGPEGQSWANKVYFLGGRVDSGSAESGDIWSFDPLDGLYVDTGWDMEEGVSNYTANLISGDDACTDSGPAIYIIGGYDKSTGKSTDLVQRICVADGQVDAVTTDPWPGKVDDVIYQPGGLAVVDGVIYAFGGFDSSTSPYIFENRTFRFDPSAAAESRWTDLGLTLGQARGYIASAVVGSRIFALGGIASYTADPFDLIPTNMVEVLDTAVPSPSWQVESSMPFATSEAKAFGIDAETLFKWAVFGNEGKIYVIGGGDWPGRTDHFLVYDIASQVWETSAPLHQARRDHAGVYIPLCSDSRYDGLPGFWVWGGNIQSDDPPFGQPEQFSFHCYSDFFYLPLVSKKS
ncbi:MAG: S8 family serine peptidase, partial [Anaerolineales bacterium]|nr:S8 family serine peptidase [Anaerolineales bacterium]